mmetsp:Transcript_28612/g.65659  ORF Transcript_28612/g.65659 Transcript_28612/m.65659 type:complete len:102 (-) Transcript_28612:266-571(-)
MRARGAQQAVKTMHAKQADDRRSRAAQGSRKMHALMGVSPLDAAARIKTQISGTIGTIAACGHTQLLLARLSALAPIAVHRVYTTNSKQQTISLAALARTK